MGQSPFNAIGSIQKVSEESYCLDFTGTHCLRDFKYLEKSSGCNFNWVPSTTGNQVAKSVPFQHFVLGKTTKDGLTYFGTVSDELGLTYYNSNENSLEVTSTFDVLTGTSLNVGCEYIQHLNFSLI